VNTLNDVITSLHTAAAALRYAAASAELLPAEPDGSMEEMGQLALAWQQVQAAYTQMDYTQELEEVACAGSAA
jgi:hypothetical protein